MLIAVAVIVVVMVMIVIVVVIVIIPVDVAEQGIGGGDAQAIAKAFDEAVCKLLAGRRGQIDRRVGRVWPTAVDRGGVVVRDVNHLWIGRSNFDYRWGWRGRIAALHRCRCGCALRRAAYRLLRRRF